MELRLRLLVQVLGRLIEGAIRQRPAVECRPLPIREETDAC